MRQFSWWQKFIRLAKYRLLIPLKRSPHPPEYTARGVMIGMAWALTPLIGVQMYLVTMTWLISRAVFRWDFNLVIALAWTWVTNVFTMLPIYYGFYLTGQVMMGNWDHLSGYGAFTTLFRESWNEDASLLQIIAIYLEVLAKEWGLSLSIGCIPYIIFWGWVSYYWSLKFIVAHRRRKETRAHKKQARAARRAEEALASPKDSG